MKFITKKLMSLLMLLSLIISMVFPAFAYGLDSSEDINCLEECCNSPVPELNEQLNYCAEDIFLCEEYALYEDYVFYDYEKACICECFEYCQEYCICECEICEESRILRYLEKKYSLDDYLDFIALGGLGCCDEDHCPLCCEKCYILFGCGCCVCFEYTCEDCSTYALYDPPYSTTFTVIFNIGGGTRVGGGELTQEVPFFGDAILPLVERTGFTFLGWSGSHVNVTDSRVVTALWDIDVFDVAFNLNGGTRTGGGELLQAINHGANAVLPTVTRTGFVLSGWTGGYTNVTSHRTITAQWTTISHNVTFALNGGTRTGGGALIQAVAHGGEASLPSVYRVGHTFMGWSGGPHTNVTGARTLTAQWQINTYNVRFINWDGSVVSSQTINHGANAALPGAAFRQGHNFISWGTGTQHINVTSDRNIAAVFQIQLFTVIFRSGCAQFFINGVGTQAPQVVTNVPWGTLLTPHAFGQGALLNSAAGTLRVPSTFGNFCICSGNIHRVMGFSQVNQRVTGNMDITFTLVNTGFVTPNYAYNLSNFTQLCGTPLIQFSNPSIIPQIALMCNNDIYRHTGWGSGGLNVHPRGATHFTHSLAADIVTPIAVRDSFSVAFNANGGTRTGGGLLNQSILRRNGATMPTVERVGHTFTGWTRTAGTSPLNDIRDNVTFLANWQINSYTVTFNLAGGTRTGGGLVSQTINHGGNAVNPPLVQREGFTFIGWAGGQNNITNNRTLTAQWVPITHPVTFVLAGGTRIGGGLLNQNVQHFGEASLPSVHRPGYTFTGWDTSHANITAPRTITAEWRINQFTVRFIDYNNQLLDAQVVDWGADATSLAVPPVRYGHVFSGWSRTYDNVTQNIMVFAQYVPQQFQIRFIDWNGRIIRWQVLNFGNSGIPPADPVKYGHHFIGWDCFHFTITEARDISINALYAPMQFYVIFLDHEGNEHSRQPVYFGESTSPPLSPSRDGHVFRGWDRDSFYITSEGNLIVNPRFIPVCLHDGCGNTNNLCDVCDKCTTHCICCRHDNCDNRYSCDTCQRCVLHCICCKHDDCNNRYSCNICQRCALHCICCKHDDCNNRYSCDTCQRCVLHCICSTPNGQNNNAQGGRAGGGNNVGNNNNQNGANNTCLHDGCNNAYTCEMCGMCEEHCTCCRYDGCDNRYSCENCQKCSEHCICDTCIYENCENAATCSSCGMCNVHCNCCAHENCNNKRICSFCGKCSEHCTCITSLADGTIISDDIFPLANQRAPLFTFMGNNVYLWGPLNIASWALVNLLLTIAGIIMAVLFVTKRKKENPDTDTKQRKRFFLTACSLCVIAILLFIITQDLTALIALFDIWTIAHMAIFITQIICIKAYKKNDEDNENQPTPETT